MSKNLILIIVTIIVVSVFSGCGNTDEASFETSSSSSGSSTITIAIDVTCTTPATIDTYIELKSGDTIVKNSDNTSIETYHDATGAKKVCLVSGSASIIR